MKIHSTMLGGIRKKLSDLRRRQKFKTFYKQFIAVGDLCFDIGANKGHRTDIFLDLNAKVVSVEPIEESYSKLLEKFENNEQVTILKLALGSAAGTKNIHISNYLEVCTISELFIEKYKNQNEHDIKWEEIRETEIRTLDQLIEEFGIPAFCKIDVEGYEIEVLKGLSQPIPTLSFEYNARLKNLALECLDILSRFEALSYNFSPYESMKFSLNAWVNKEEFYSFIKTLPPNLETGDVYVKHNGNL